MCIGVSEPSKLFQTSSKVLDLAPSEATNQNPQEAMRRGLAKLAPPPSTISAATFSTFSGAGGFGRGRGSGGSPSPPSSVPGEPSSEAPDEDPFLSAGGRGRGRGSVDAPRQSSPLFPSFPSFVTSSQGQGQGRGRGVTSPGSTSENPETASRKPVFFSRYDQVPPKPADENSLPPKPDYSSFVSALERGNPSTMPSKTESSTKKAGANRPIHSREEATRRALEVLSRGGQDHDGTGRGESRMQGRGRGRGRGRGHGTEQVQDDGMVIETFFDDREDSEDVEEQLKQTLGEEKMKVLEEAFEIGARLALPTSQEKKLEEDFEDAVETNCMVIFFSPFCFIRPNLFV